jgi:iron complex outermembrane receptor protein
MARRALSWFGGGLALSLAIAAASAAPAPPRVTVDFAIPAQPLSGALIAFGKQANVQVLTAGEAIADLRSEGAAGALTLEQGMTSLLRGTGLEYEAVDAGTVVVKRRPMPVAASYYRSSLLEAKPSVPIVASLAAIQVQGTLLGDVGYKADSTRAATRTDTPLAKVPQSVSVVTRDLMDTQQALTVADAVRNVAGVQYMDGFDGPALFRIRGFNAGNGMTDGMPNGVARTEDLPPLIGIERIEVLKGPEAILGDASVNNNFGGLVNVVMKRPQSDPVRQLSWSLGRYDGARLGLDLAGAIGHDDGWTYRLVAAGNHADRSAQGYRGQRSAYLAPSLGWERGATRFTLGYELVTNRVPGPDHTVLLGDSLAAMSPYGILPGNPGDHSTYRTNRAVFTLEQGLDSHWTFRSRGQYVKQRTSGQGWSLTDGYLTGAVDATARSFRYSDAFYTLQNDLTGVFEQGDTTHTVVFGVDYARTKAGRDRQRDTLKTGPSQSYNLFADAMLPSARVSTDEATTVQTLGGGDWTTETGLFLQDQIALGERWDVLLALRRTSYELSTSWADGSPRRLRKDQWVPKAGVLFKLAPDVALYANHTTGFQANSLLGEDGQPLPPAKSRQWEAGTRIELFQHRARLNLAWYRITLDHSVDYIAPEPPYFATPGPGQTNHGLEVEFAGQITRGLEGVLNYTNSHIRNDDGTQPVAAPRQLLSAWASYRSQREPLRSWGVAAGIAARSRSVGRLQGGGYFDLPGQASVDANVTYYGDSWRLTLGLRNLFDRTLYAVNADQSFVPVREGRMAMVTGVYDF